MITIVICITVIVLITIITNSINENLIIKKEISIDYLSTIKDIDNIINIVNKLKSIEQYGETKIYVEQLSDILENYQYEEVYRETNEI